MNRREPCYDAGSLSLLLESRLGSDDETAVTRHLDRCDDCRAKLEGLAADASEWTAMRDMLREVDGDADFSWTATRPFLRDVAEEHHVPLDFLAPTDDPASLGRLGHYEVTGVIGRGGMSVVLKAFDRPLNRYVAVKVLAPQLAANGSARRRFEREAQAAAAVVHEHAIAIHSVAEFNGLPYLVMPYFPSRSLQRRIDDAGPLSVVETLRIARQVAAGLAAAHAQGLVHRDVRPANILLENGVERAVVTDFGLARAIDDATVTCSGVIAGTPQYMAPEQARGESIDRRADLFSLGSVIYAMCTGRAPFRAETTLGVLRRVCDDEPHPIRELNPEVPAWLADFVARLHAKDPAARFQEAREVADLLERGLAHVQNPTAVPNPPYEAPKPVISQRIRRRCWLVAAGLTAVCSAATAIWFSTLPPSESTARKATAPQRRATETQPSSPVIAAASDSSAHEPDDADIRDHVRAIEAAWSRLPGATDPWGDAMNQLRSRAAHLELEMSAGAPDGTPFTTPRPVPSPKESR